MSQVIRISDHLYERLEAHATGFDTPSNVIERILKFYEGETDSKESNNLNQPSSNEIEPAKQLKISYHPSNEEDFKKKLLSTKQAYIKFHFTNGQTEIKEWNATRFTPKSSVNGNLRSGYLRGWKEKGIYKAEISVNLSDFTK